MATPTCPNCDAAFDVRDSVSGPGAVPRPDDVAICGHCGALAIWVSPDVVRPATTAEIAELVQRRSVRTALVALAAAWRTGDTIAAAVGAARRVHARNN